MWKPLGLCPETLTSHPSNHLSLALWGVPPPPLLPNAPTPSLYFPVMALALKSPLSPRTFSRSLAPSKVCLNLSDNFLGPWNDEKKSVPVQPRFYDKCESLFQAGSTWSVLECSRSLLFFSFSLIYPSNFCQIFGLCWAICLPVILLFGIR